MDKIINNILDIGEKYKFEHLDDYEEGSSHFLRIEYYGDNIIYKDENDFDNKCEYRKFVNEQGDVVCDEFEKMDKELKKEKIDYENWEWDYYDYPVIEIELKVIL